MRILLTGASSFTGLWFARALATRGHHVVAPLRRSHGAYEGIRATRVALLGDVAEVVWDAEFGGPRFLDVAASGPWDVFCHHAAAVDGYRSPDFDVAMALQQNTFQLSNVLDILIQQNIQKIVLTGSIFEAGEGVGDEPIRAFSPYGLSKSFSYAVFDYWCRLRGVPLGKFVIPNPFGPLEEERFCAYLIRNWRSGSVPAVRTPDYVRDNIHVDLLAMSYARFVESADRGRTKAAPSGYVESQGAFARRLAEAMEPRLGMKCPLEFSRQSDFSEPRIRINTMPAVSECPEWSEEAAWDLYASSV